MAVTKRGYSQCLALSEIAMRAAKSSSFADQISSQVYLEYPLQFLLLA